MSTGNLDSFLKGSFITIISFVVILMILKHWKGAEWLKIGSTIFIALIVLDFANNQGAVVLGVVKWFASLFGINFK
ncbi:hypothetical protein [Enterococcus termitis]|uniref:Uncharacterized protein n=1 Tax=Enterococcus termitis TaxID=332950 RepID=A0A1E5GVV4_9ENTE|nr:hypothetical protein [Enterococcus termitis]OEG16786.1 hypothetical protein BCR25_04100 [Enterococcus termitis]OJG99495.1 hypothetical protein RV18_GL001563 [Enterococcus termitis]